VNTHSLGQREFTRIGEFSSVTTPVRRGLGLLAEILEPHGGELFPVVLNECLGSRLIGPTEGGLAGTPH